MEKRLNIVQFPPPGESRVVYCGDCVTFILKLPAKTRGTAWVRTNLGAAAVSRKEIILRVEQDEIKLGGAWVDIEMALESDLVYKIVLPLHQTGFFQAKCFFLPEKSNTPVWPTGDNCIFNVEPAGTCCANIIYNAFVRQFGRSKYGEIPSGADSSDAVQSEVIEEKELSPLIQKLDAQGYTVIPESGKFRDLKREVGFIFSELGCRVLHLLPIHPTPTTYARMGRFGSPYASLNFTEVDPALAEFDPLATPLEQFMELVDAVHSHNGYLFMDIAINHTGWAASIHETNPEWLVRGADGRIEAPGAWGVVWADLTKLDYSNTGLWRYMANVFLLWCHRGVDGFRCDAGYMVPIDAWEYIVAKVRLEYPETLFFLEGLGGHLETTRDILNRANFNWAYSELFQNYTREEISAYLPTAWEMSDACGHMIHFAETHDNNRLASVSTRYAKMRTSLCALFSVCGGFGFANGVEWFATQKIDVHESASLNWGDPINQVDHISRLNRILTTHPAFFGHTRLALIQTNQSPCLVLCRRNEVYDKTLLILVNLDCENSNLASWQTKDTGINERIFHDLLSNRQVIPEDLKPDNREPEDRAPEDRVQEDLNADESHHLCGVHLAPGEILVLTPDMADLDLLEQNRQNASQTPDRVYLQKLRAKVLSIHIVFNGYQNLMGVDVDQQARVLADDPVEFIRSFNRDSAESRVIIFEVERDLKRQLMIPPDFFLLIRCKTGFRAEILDTSRSDTSRPYKDRSTKISLGCEEGMKVSGERGFFALFSPEETKNQHKEYTLNLRIFEPHGTRIETASLLYLAPLESLYMSASFTRKEIVKTPFLKLLGTTRRGGMMRAAAWWGRLDSRYDALLGANMDKSMPENRWMVLSRCRIWAIFQGYSRALVPDCLERFTFSYDHGGRWLFHVPTSEGRYFALELMLSIDQEENHVRLSLVRKNCPREKGVFLDDDKPVTLIIRPDIEDRSFHETVKAFKGPEQKWPQAISVVQQGFVFSLARGNFLNVSTSKGRFVAEPEWYYMVNRPLEAQRGLDPESDLFSPGYFEFSCLGGEIVELNAAVVESRSQNIDSGTSVNPCESLWFETGMPLAQAVYKSLDAFLVNRGPDKSVIAGYPWFLDWGRDSLIFCRGLIELGRFADAKAILRLFGRFEDKGTLPNMICGRDAGNIETSDAPLWFFACCKDLIEQEKCHDFLDERLGDRSVREVLLSMAQSLIEGTRTGVVADPETLLLYSPSHFTWMDTNFPAGSPRQGYPVEIQALWYNALMLLEEIDPVHTQDWALGAKRVQKYIQMLFYDEAAGFFADCLHSDGPVGAKKATPDDALRPNQLFLFTLDVIRDKKIAQTCVETCRQLLVPGGIRSLADRRVDMPIPIIYKGRSITDPHFPYFGQYKGDEDTQRKPAYHNGTAWTWPFPVFCEAWAAVFGKNSHSTCLAWLGSVIGLMRKGAAGYIPEILDGDFPHVPRGCDAQAWASSEVARVIHKLSEKSDMGDR